MKVVLCITLLLASSWQVQSANPIEKVLSMLTDLEAKIVREGKVAQKTYSEFAEWCEDRSKNVGFEIKDGKNEVAEQSATIESSTANIASLNAKIEELADALSVDEGDLAAATKIRNTESADFKATEKDLVETVDILERAILILEKEMKKGGAAMVQVQKAGNNMVQALTALVDASLINSGDAAKLTALMQGSSSEDDEDTGAPAASAYEGHSGGIIDTLEGLLDKAKGSLDKARSTERNNANNFAMLKQSLNDEIKVGNQDLAKTKKALAATQETKATAQGDLAVATKDLNEDTATLKTLHQDCLEKSQDFEAETKSRGEELNALSTAKKIIAEASSGADSLAYGASFLQTSSIQQTDNSLQTTADLANFEAVRLVRDLARKTGDAALTQLATRMATAIRRAKAGADPFAKVKELIKNMVETLLNDAQADASHKAYCDKELGDSAAKKAEKTATVDKLSTQIDSMSSKSAQLKEQTAKLQKELADLARSQGEMDRIRMEEKTTFRANKKEMEEGINGIKTALKVLRDYYAKDDKAHDSADGSSSGIVSMLEVVESDFTKGLSEMTVAEQTSAADYDKESRSNSISKATKEQSVKYKTKEFKGLDQSVAETKSDRSTTQEELAAVMQYLGKLDDICIAKAEPFSERKRRREEEISGLKEALNILNGEAVLLQRQAGLRGAHRH
jgi:chromosome segregation ATPase